ncbi:hypothetical protein GA830_11085 [Mesorhizobium sp. NBSH29]|uniref:hypothetical protein n=1 Tax=Mesorhizobium sp. NBSH29 TaxID=2654249 RepID=UPI00189692D3|nr:hypothetical protein [Mesorhizobium sp. NBSH29]QPC87224.1 hypothetical protein GA830_11085 [Mesorhizobium sp. NBSH29]
MKGICPVFQTLSASLFALTLLASQAGAAPFMPIEDRAPILLVQSDCFAVGEQIAAQNGGTLAKAAPSTDGGQPVCVVVVLIPGKEGERPRRVEMVVPQG